MLSRPVSDGCKLSLKVALRSTFAMGEPPWFCTVISNVACSAPIIGPGIPGSPNGVGRPSAPCTGPKNVGDIPPATPGSQHGLQQRCDQNPLQPAMPNPRASQLISRPMRHMFFTAVPQCEV